MRALPTEDPIFIFAILFMILKSFFFLKMYYVSEE